jgi:small subunit ribosomal protein S17e
MKRIEKGPVRGISLRLQEEERERKMDFIPDRSEIQVDKIEVKNDKVLKQMIKDLGVRKLIPGLQKDNRGPRRPRD